MSQLEAKKKGVLEITLRGPWRAYPNLIYLNKVDKGGHFATSEQPELFFSKLRAAFRSLR